MCSFPVHVAVSHLNEECDVFHCLYVYSGGTHSRSVALRAKYASSPSPSTGAGGSLSGAAQPLTPEHFINPILFL